MKKKQAVKFGIDGLKFSGKLILKKHIKPLIDEDTIKDESGEVAYRKILEPWIDMSMTVAGDTSKVKTVEINGVIFRRVEPKKKARRR